MRIVKEVIFHRLRVMFNRADAIQELPQRQGVVWHDAEFHFRALQNLQQQLAVNLRVIDANKRIGGFLRMLRSERCGFRHRPDESAVSARIFLTELLCGVQHHWRIGAALLGFVLIR